MSEICGATLSGIHPIAVRLRRLKTSFSPHLANRTTSVAQVNISINQPHYLIHTEKNEVMRSIIWGSASSTEVVLLSKLGRNKIISDDYIPLGITTVFRKNFHLYINLTGNVYCTFTGTPSFLPGLNLFLNRRNSFLHVFEFLHQI